MTLAEAAIEYARRGWPVLPCHVLSKQPWLGAWQRSASTDTGLIVGWWEVAPKRNVGLLCGVAFDVLDLEVYGIEPLRDWMTERGYRLPDAPVAWTGRGGMHVYLAPSGRPKRDLWLGDQRLGELRGTGAQVIAPPSRVQDPDTRVIGDYRWIVPPGSDPLPSAPAWLDELRKPDRPQRAAQPVTRPATVDEGIRKLDALGGAVVRAPEGQRNTMLYWAARRAREEGHPPAVVELVLGRHARAIGLTDREVRLTLRSAAEAE